MTDTTPDYARLIAAWEAAMDGVTPGPWRPSTFGFQIVSDFPEAAWQSVVELRTIACTAPHVENEMKSQETIARWLARCSPDNISALLSALRTLLERNAELERLLAAVRDDAMKLDNDFCAMETRAEAAEAKLAEAMKVISALLEPFGDASCWFDHHGYCQEHFIQEECCVAAARDFLKENGNGQ